MKKLLLLGGSSYIVPVIKMAHEMGIYVITCDYLPNNIAHRYSDEYRNVSTIDKEAVLSVAQEMKVDGVMAFACDSGVVSAAYAAEKLGLPFQGSYEAVSILQDKGLFRKFLRDNGFNSPQSKRYTEAKLPFQEMALFRWPVIVKPVDSAGSKGVTRVDSPDELEAAISAALGCSHNGAFIIEEFLAFDGYHSDSDFFTVDGKLVFSTYSDQLFDPEADNPYTPTQIIWPSTMMPEHQDELTREAQRLMELLHMKTGIYNVESCVGTDGKAYLMEVSPRGGGDRIAEIQQLAMGANLIENELRSAVGMPLTDIANFPCDGYWCEMIIHARPGQTGTFKRLVIDPEVEEKYIKLVALSAGPGDAVKPFTGANMALGDMFLRFDSREELNEVMAQSSKWMDIELDAY